MAERSFVQEVQKLRLGYGDEFNGEGILAVTKALLQSGVSYDDRLIRCYYKTIIFNFNKYFFIKFY